MLRDLWHLRSQMFAIAAVMACGMAMFVGLRSMRGWLSSAQDWYYESYRFPDVFASVRRAPAGIERQLAALPGVGAVRTRIVRDVTLDLPGLDEPGTGRLVGIPEQRVPMLNDLHLRQGRWIRPDRPGEVIVSDAFARANNFRPGSAIPAVINGRWQSLQIVGTALSPEFVYEMRGLGDLFPDNRRFGVIWMGERALAAAFEMTGAVTDISLTLAPRASEADVITAVDDLLAPYGGAGAYGRSEHLSAQFLASEIEQNRVSSVLIPAIFLGVTAFLLHMVLARLVATQRDQIAVLKAFGYDNSTIAGHYFGLAAGPTLLGAAVGTGLGIWLAVAMADLYAQYYQFPLTHYQQDWATVAGAFLVSGGAALVGAVSAVRRAVRLPPAEAMRPEAPAVFRAGLVDRLRLQRLIPPSARIVIRNLERRPIRAMLSVLGISLGTAIVLIGWVMFDAIDVLIEVQFESAQRYDAMVVFEGPRSPRARWELASIAGVRRIEPFRVTPVRLRHTHLSKRTSLLGIEPGAQLQGLVDRHLVRREVPRGGVVLSRILATQLGVRTGDTLTVEVLEGKRGTHRLVVASLSDDLVGGSATIDLSALHTLIGEGGSLSGAYLLIDPVHAQDVYRTLQRTPAVAGVVVQEATIAGFRETIAQSYLIMIFVILLFAGVIAGGIVYNGARVALSERGRELASLRVLGFTKREVTTLLLGEQTILTLVGIPVGLLLGAGLAWLMTEQLTSELFRFPLVIRRSTVVTSILIMLAVTALAAVAVRRRIHRLDLIAVLKTRE